VSLTREAATVRNLRDAPIRVAEESSGALDTPIQNVAMRRHASRRVKHPEKMAAAASDLGRKFPKGEIRFESALNELLNTT